MTSPCHRPSDGGSFEIDGWRINPPNSGESSRERGSGLGLPGSSASALQGRWPSFGVAEKARIGRDLFRSEDDPPAAKPATPLLSLRWTFRAQESVCGDHGRRA